jgi:hypothetical protein
MSPYTTLVRRPLVELYAERYTRSNQTVTVRIDRGIVPDLTTIYTGRGRVHRMVGSVQMGFGDEPQYMVSGIISVPILDADDEPVKPHVNDHVTVLTHHDPAMVGRTFRVMHVDAGGQFNGVVAMSVLGSEPSPTTVADDSEVTRVRGTAHTYSTDT